MSRTRKDVPSKKKRGPEKPLPEELWRAIQPVVGSVRSCFPVIDGWDVGWSGPSGRTVRVRLGGRPRVLVCERIHRAAFNVVSRLPNMPEGWRLEVTSDPEM